MKLKVYGCRGTMPTTRFAASKYGSNTTCMTLEYDGQVLILDAGSGLAQMDRFSRIFMRDDKPYNILLSHLHMDHIIGLTVFSEIWLEKAPVRIYTINRDERPLKEQVLSPFNPPYWPVSMTRYGNVECIELKYNQPFELDLFTITPFEPAHNDKASSFCITCNGKKMVYLVDNEMQALSSGNRDVLFEFSKNADLIVFDSAYSLDDYPNKKGWGHSSIEDGFAFAEVTECKKMLFTHFSFEYSDQELEFFEMQVLQKSESFYFAREGLEILI